MTYRWKGIALLAIVGVLGAIAWNGQRMARAEETPGQDGPAAVEPDMHEFMEYIYQPSYKRLKPAMASPPTNNVGWKTIKAEGLILAESGNLLLLRSPDEDSAEWKNLSLATRDLGAKLYQAGKKKDFAAAKVHYEALIQKCNACHDKFAHGEHQLKP